MLGIAIYYVTLLEAEDSQQHPIRWLIEVLAFLSIDSSSWLISVPTLLHESCHEQITGKINDHLFTITRLQCSHIFLSLVYYTAAVSSELMNMTLTVMSNVVHALCTSNNRDMSTCSIDYSTNPWYQNLSTPVSGPINTPFPVPIMEMASGTYYYQTTAFINSTLKTIVRSCFQLVMISSGEEQDAVTVLLHMPNCTSHNMDSKENRLTLEWYQLGVTIGIFAIILIPLTMAIVVLSHKGTVTFDVYY